MKLTKLSMSTKWKCLSLVSSIGTPHKKIEDVEIKKIERKKEKTKNKDTSK